MELTLISGVVDMSVEPQLVKPKRGADQIFIRVEYTNDFKTFTTITVSLYGGSKDKFEKYTSSPKFHKGDTLGITLVGHLRFSSNKVGGKLHFICAENINLYNVTSIQSNEEMNLLSHLYQKKKKARKTK